MINFDQSIPKGLTDQISVYLETGRTLSLNLTNLSIICRCADNGNTFRATLWQGIGCVKKSNEIATSEMRYLGATMRA